MSEIRNRQWVKNVYLPVSPISSSLGSGQAGYFQLQIIEGLNILQNSTDPGIFVLVGWWWGGGPGPNDRIKLIFFFLFKSSTYLTDRSNGFFFQGKLHVGGRWGQSRPTFSSWGPDSQPLTRWIRTTPLQITHHSNHDWLTQMDNRSHMWLDMRGEVESKIFDPPYLLNFDTCRFEKHAFGGLAHRKIHAS